MYVRWPDLGNHGGLGDLLWNATFIRVIESGLKFQQLLSPELEYQVSILGPIYKKMFGLKICNIPARH